jgi:hypothetical protein
METMIQLNEEPAIIAREPDATMQLTPQDNQLMSERRILCFKSALRLEWQGQDGQHEREQPDHPASLGDSIMPSTQTRFSVDTGERDALRPARQMSHGALGRLEEIWMFIDQEKTTGGANRPPPNDPLARSVSKKNTMISFGSMPASPSFSTKAATRPFFLSVSVPEDTSASIINICSERGFGSAG